MKIFNLILILFCFISFFSCSKKLDYWEARNDVWDRSINKAKETNEPKDWNAERQDTSCLLFTLHPNKQKIVVRGTEIQLTGEFILKHGKYAAKGKLMNGVPTGKWVYMNLHNFIYVSEYFWCAKSYRVTNSVAEEDIFLLGRLSNRNHRTRKKVKLENYEAEVVKIIRNFRNKLHKKIYEKQQE